MRSEVSGSNRLRAHDKSKSISARLKTLTCLLQERRKRLRQIQDVTLVNAGA